VRFAFCIRKSIFLRPENEERSRTAIYTISHDADLRVCMLVALPAKERLFDRALNEALGKQCRKIHVRDAR
jgi:hypothetical protein